MQFLKNDFIRMMGRKFAECPATLSCDYAKEKICEAILFPNILVVHLWNMLKPKCVKIYLRTLNKERHTSPKDNVIITNYLKNIRTCSWKPNYLY